MRALLRLHTALVGRILSPGSCQTFGGLLPRQNRHFVRENVRWSSTQAGGSDKKKHKADLVLEAHFEPTNYPAGCDKDNYRSYFKRGKVYVLDLPLKNRLGNITEAIRGLRPDAVVLTEKPPSPSDAAQMRGLPAEMTRLVCPKKIALAQIEAANALPKYTVVCDVDSMGLSRKQTLSILLWPTKRMKELGEKLAGESELESEETDSPAQKLFKRTHLRVLMISRMRELYSAYVLQRMLNERASEKYQRLHASEKDKLEPVRIVVVVVSVPKLEGIEENWQRPIDKAQIDELLGKARLFRIKILAGIALFVAIGWMADLQQLAWDLATAWMKAGGKI